ncbi:MAG: hypothetical protein HWQ38_28975 [Nostoc sp. NMS7]|uniref:hypothetical protein n=1 Tax=Nostoc sp. NMS7 TaxID=2815391 RepID=UPI0025DF6341|nr:hypothetical protein [Nostoc sp. NMS7]MBN3950288.1 hypothetical protein [Nostoc sp. NMS7]
MLSKTEFDAWCCRLNLSSQTQNLIEKIRSSEPSRRVGGGRKNVSGLIPVEKWELLFNLSLTVLNFLLSTNLSMMRKF